MNQEIELNEQDGETMAITMEEASDDLELELEEQLAKESMESLFGESMQNF